MFVVLGWLGSIGTLLLRIWAVVRTASWSKWLWFYFFTYLGGIIGKVLSLVGVTLAVNNFVMPSLTPLIAGQLLGLPSTWVSLLALTKVDQGITIILTAVAIAVGDRVMMVRRRNSWQTPL